MYPFYPNRYPNNNRPQFTPFFPGGNNPFFPTPPEYYRYPYIPVPIPIPVPVPVPSQFQPYYVSMPPQVYDNSINQSAEHLNQMQTKQTAEQMQTKNVNNQNDNNKDEKKF